MKKNRVKIIVILGVVIGLMIGILIGVAISKDKSNNMDNEVAEKNDLNENMQFMEIETPYCTLYYPDQWEDTIEVEKTDEEVYTVKFSVTLSGKEKQHLFDIVFNTESQEFGYLDLKDGKVNVEMINAEVVFDDSWTQDEKNRIYAMQEEANMTLEMLKIQNEFKEY